MQPVSVPLALSSARNSSDSSSCSAALWRYTSSCADTVTSCFSGRSCQMTLSYAPQNSSGPPRLTYTLT